MDWIIRELLIQLEKRHIVNKEDLEIYGFGLECTILKFLHLLSYLFIGICMGEILSLAVSGSVLILLRQKAGGVHAGTRLGCYIYSCTIVILLCLLNKAPFIPIYSIIGVIVADLLIILFAPLENENRELDADEKKVFRKQVIGYLIVVNMIIAIFLVVNKYLFVAYWMCNGLIFTGALLVLGVVKQAKNSNCK